MVPTVYATYMRIIVLVIVVVAKTFRLLCPPVFIRCISIRVTYDEFGTEPFILSKTVLSPLHMSTDISENRVSNNRAVLNKDEIFIGCVCRLL